MAYQPNLFSPDPDEPAATPDRGERPGQRAPDAAIQARRSERQPSAWLQRTELLVRVIVRLYLGLLIIALPWMRFWSENGLFSYLPGATLVADSGFVRGLVSGLGVLNIVIALQELFSSSSRR
jgi:hypothetical protein